MGATNNKMEASNYKISFPLDVAIGSNDVEEVSNNLFRVDNAYNNFFFSEIAKYKAN